MGDDDTRYRFVARRGTPVRESDESKARGGRTRRSTTPAAPSAIAHGTVPSGNRMRRPTAELLDDEPSAVMMPRRFGGHDLVVEDHGAYIAVVLPGALRLVGTRDEAVALAAALLHTVERTGR